MKHLLISNTRIRNIDFYKNLIQLECSNTLIKELHPYPKLKTLEYKNTLIKKLPYLPSLELDDEVDDEVDDEFYFAENSGYITLFNKKTMEKVEHTWLTVISPNFLIKVGLTVLSPNKSWIICTPSSNLYI